jgi:hypothetical protein
VMFAIGFFIGWVIGKIELIARRIAKRMAS